MKAVVDKIKNVVSPSKLISGKVQLKQRGLGEYSGLCPFHNEKTPSFTVTDIKGFFHCFGCGAHGDIFSFIMKSEGITYAEALERLALEAGVILPKKTRQEIESERKIDLYYQIHEAAAYYYQSKLKSLDGRKALSYLKKRGLTEEVIAKYRLGYAPNYHDELLNYLLKSFDRDDIVKSNIISQSENGHLYNLLRNRVIFPIINKYNKVIAFGGRILDVGEPKYINSKESLIFRKGQELYGLNLAYKSIVEKGEAIITEGYVDVIALAQNDVNYAVAPLGTAIKPEQIQALWHICDEPTICMDSDKAGQNSMVKIAYSMLEYIRPGKSIKFMKLQGAKDPDEVIKSYGVDYFLELKSMAMPLADMLFTIESNKKPISTPEQIASLKQRLQLLTQRIKDRGLQKDYKYYFLGKYYNLFSKKRRSRKEDETIRQEVVLKSTMLETDTLVHSILHVLLEHPNLLQLGSVFEELASVEIANVALEEIRSKLLSLADIEAEEERIDLLSNLRIDFKKKINYDAKLGLANYDCKEGDDYCKHYLERLFKINTLNVIRSQISYIIEELKDNANEEYFSKLATLKNYEEEIKTQLGII